MVKMLGYALLAGGAGTYLYSLLGTTSKSTLVGNVGIVVALLGIVVLNAAGSQIINE